MNIWTIRASALAALLALAACGDDPEPERSTEETGEATGNVLGGSISDDMIPLEELRSQSPPAPRAAGESNGDEGGEAPAEDDGEGAPETTAAEPPESDPAPEASLEE